MPRRSYPFLEGGTYHLYNRGNNRQQVYRCDSDYRSFLKGLRSYLGVAPLGTGEAAGTRLLAYCLMPNHYHLLVQPLDDALSSRMQRLLISYTKALNAKYGRVGALFQGQLQAVSVENDNQLIHLSAYIHRNPVEAGLAARAEAWEYSSCREYLGLRQGRLPQPGVVLHLCGGRRGYRRLLTGGPGEAATGLEHLILEG